MAWLQRHRWWVRGVLLVAIVALLSLDGVTIGRRTHAADVRAAARRAAAARVAYADQLRTSLVPVFRTLQPLQNALDLRTTHPNAGIDYPVRDALAHTTAAAALRKEAAAISALKPPADLTSLAGDVTTSLQRLVSLTQSFAAHAGDETDSLANDLDTGVFSDLEGDESSLASAVDGVFLPIGVTEPPVAGPNGGSSPVSLAPSHDSWLLETDSACNDGEQILSTEPAKETTLAEFRSTLSLEIKAGDLVQKEIAVAKAPAGDTAARTIVQQLSVFARLVGDDREILADSGDGNTSATLAALQNEEGLTPDFDALGHAFAVYGNTTCATFFSTDTGTSSSSGGSGGPTSAA